MIASDEIDLLELFLKIWRRKWWVVGATTLTAALALAYLFMATPIYQARVYLMPPSASDVEALNYSGDYLTNEYSIDDAYRDAIDQLKSRRQLLEFYRSEKLDRIYRLSSEVSEQKAFAKFHESISITAPKKGALVFVDIKLDGEDADEVAVLLNRYVNKVGRAVIDSEVRNLIELRDRTIIRLDHEIESKRKLAKLNRGDQIDRLEEAYKVAQAVGVKSISSNVINKVPSGQNINLISLDTDLISLDTVYMHGTNALGAEIEVLKARGSDDHVIRGLRDLQEGIEILQAIEVDASAMQPFQVDMEAQVPEAPIKPKKRLVLALSIVLGGMLGILLSLVIPGPRLTESRPE